MRDAVLAQARREVRNWEIFISSHLDHTPENVRRLRAEKAAQERFERRLARAEVRLSEKRELPRPDVSRGFRPAPDAGEFPSEIIRFVEDDLHSTSRHVRA